MMDLDDLTGATQLVEHCGEPMTWKVSRSTWEGQPGQGWSVTVSEWACGCGATLTATVRVPS